MMERQENLIPIPARPFLKWAGGKSQLLEQLVALLPPELTGGQIERYVEPFLGGGAMFLAVVQRYALRDVWLTDINPELILVYRVIQQDVEALIAHLHDLAEEYLAAEEADRSRLYYRVRAAYNTQLPAMDFTCYTADWAARAAAMLFLNKTCYNGLFRVNAKGEFNVPHGRYRRPTICDPDNLRRVALLLRGVTLGLAPYRACAEWVNDRTFVYFDPPYRPLSTTAGFTSYSRTRFDEGVQVDLARFYAELHQQSGAKLMLSNSDPTNVDPDDDFFVRHYAPFHLHHVYANRMINTRGDGRGKIRELVITNY